MTKDRMTELLSESIHVTAEDAQAALEGSEWSLLDAAILLQREQRRRASIAKAAQARPDERAQQPGKALRGLFARIILFSGQSTERYGMDFSFPVSGVEGGDAAHR